MPGAKTSHRGCAAKIRRDAIKFPELSKSQLARRAGCHPSNVTGVLKGFLKSNTEEDLRDFQASKAEVFDAIQLRFLESLTPSKLAKSSALQSVTAAAILEDKARLVRGQATGINVTALLDVAQLLRDASGRTP